MDSGKTRAEKRDLLGSSIEVADEHKSFLKNVSIFFSYKSWIKFDEKSSWKESRLLW